MNQMPRGPAAYLCAWHHYMRHISKPPLFKPLRLLAWLFSAQ